jgi:hypothetical protein
LGEFFGEGHVEEKAGEVTELEPLICADFSETRGRGGGVRASPNRRSAGAGVGAGHEPTRWTVVVSAAGSS